MLYNYYIIQIVIIIIILSMYYMLQCAVLFALCVLSHSIFIKLWGELCYFPTLIMRIFVLFLPFLGNSEWCLGLKPGSALRIHSWKDQGTIHGIELWIQVGLLAHYTIVQVSHDYENLDIYRIYLIFLSFQTIGVIWTNVISKCSFCEAK